MAAIRPCTGTTADWEAVKDSLILKEREIGVEINTKGHAIIRQGDGKSKFFSLPIIVNNARYEEILALTEGHMNTVNNFSKNMTEAANSANNAATAASGAAQTATAAAKACEGIVDGLNTMVDTVTKKSCVLTIEGGIITIREA
nr:MAG: Major tropism determinant N-terminal domain [Bacteriophage sp.]